jgi:putative peptidoglycan lipid II flippase
VPNILYILLAGRVLNTVFVPQVVRAMKNPDGGRATPTGC